jgi:hypothetical protein
VLEVSPIAPDWVVVLTVSSELVSPEFPDMQGIYREFSQNWAEPEESVAVSG